MSHRPLSTIGIPATAPFAETARTVVLPPTGTHHGHRRLSWTMLAILVLVAVAVYGAVARAPGHARPEIAAPQSRHAPLPADAALAISRGLGSDLPTYRLAQSAGGFVAHNARQGLTASFGARGATIGARDDAKVSIALQAIGFGDALHPVSPLGRSPEPTASNTDAAGQPNGLPTGLPESSRASPFPVGPPAPRTAR